tara:strand:+ start:2679 stop:3347 length:669 start_codon:yes stop_codon:yes gene_type:complete
MKRVVLSWSSGKDSAWTLFQLQQTEGVVIVGLLTTINSEFNRVAMHAVREELLDAQAEAAGLPLFKVPLPWPCSNTDYEDAIRTAFDELRLEHNATHVAYGDLFLEDVRQYRIDLMKGSKLTPLFPIWGLNTTSLADDMLSSGLSAYLTCVDPKQLPEKFSGHKYDNTFLSQLDNNVDPCGENGEFHTFVYSGPMFESDVPITIGDSVKRDGFVFTDLTLAD